MAQYIPFPQSPTRRLASEAEAAAWLTETLGPTPEALTAALPPPRTLEAGEFLVQARLGELPGADLLAVAWRAAESALEMAHSLNIQIDPRGAAGGVGQHVALADAFLGAFDKAHNLNRQKRKI